MPAAFVYLLNHNQSQPSMKRFFVSGIDTNVGKTVAAAVLTQALGADYWKPVQSGDLEQSDTLRVQSLVNHPNTYFHPETYRLTTPASPHYSAEVDGIRIERDAFQLPQTDNHLVVEGAGGLFVPLNDQYLLLDLIQDFQLPVVLVVNFYLGSINHTLSSIYALQQRQIPIAGLLFNGAITPSSESYILQYTQLPVLGRLPQIDHLDAAAIENLTKELDPILLN